MKIAAFLIFTALSFAQNVTVTVWNGIPDQKALFYGYLSLEGGLPLTRGTTLWIPVDKGMLVWDMFAVSPLDKSETLSGDFNVDANLFYDEHHNPSRLFVPRYKTSIHCEASVLNQPTSFGVMFVENAPGKYGCVIQH